MVFRWNSYLEKGIFSLSVPQETPLGGGILNTKVAEYWTTGRPYWDMETEAPELFTSLVSSGLVIFKVSFNFMLPTRVIEYRITLGRCQVSDVLITSKTCLWTSQFVPSATESEAFYLFQSEFLQAQIMILGLRVMYVGLLGLRLEQHLVSGRNTLKGSCGILKKINYFFKVHWQVASRYSVSEPSKLMWLWALTKLLPRGSMKMKKGGGLVDGKHFFLLHPTRFSFEAYGKLKDMLWFLLFPCHRIIDRSPWMLDRVYFLLLDDS